MIGYPSISRGRLRPSYAPRTRSECRKQHFLFAWVEVRLPILLVFRCNPVHGEPDIRVLFDFDQLH